MIEGKKMEIMKRLEDYHRNQGVAFFSKEDAEDYFRGLVGLIENIIEENALV